MPASALTTGGPYRGHHLEIVGRARNGATRYRYRAYEFTIEPSHGALWWCHGGVRIPRDPAAERLFEGDDDPWELIGLVHETSWASLSRRAIVRKITRAIDRHVASRTHERQLADGPAFT